MTEEGIKERDMEGITKLKTTSEFAQTEQHTSVSPRRAATSMRFSGKDINRSASKRTQLRSRIKNAFRKAITGDSNRSLRRHIQEIPQVKLIDKWCFTLSIVHLLLSEMILFTKPQFFKWYYSVMLCLLLTVRVFQYYPKGWHYFMFDFCYYVNALVLIHMFICPRNTELFQMIFVFANGPVLSAIVVWRNSMVFHSVDKMTSLFIHCFPPLYTFCHEWLDPTTARPQVDPSINVILKNELSFRGWIIWPTIFYWIWQCLYLWKTEYVDKDYLNTHSHIITSMRWIANDENNSMNKLATKLCRKLFILAPLEKFNATTIKTKIIFVLLNFTYFLVTVLPTKWMFQSSVLNLTCMSLAFVMSVYNGANYYIEVFSERYNAELKRKDTC